MTDFWFNHFNVFTAKGILPWVVLSYERDVIRPPRPGEVPRSPGRRRRVACNALLPGQLDERGGLTERER